MTWWLFISYTTAGTHTDFSLSRPTTSVIVPPPPPLRAPRVAQGRCTALALVRPRRARGGRCVDSASPHLLPPGFSRCPLSLHPRTPRTRLGTGGDSHGSSAAGAAQRTPTSLQLQCTTKTARARRSPSAGLPCALARTLPRRPRRSPQEPQRPPLHSTPLAQDLQRHPTPAPQLPARCTLPQHSTRAYG